MKGQTKPKLTRAQAIEKAKQRPQFRALEIQADWINVDERTITVPISSETPVMRWWGPEILEHGADTVIHLERIKQIGSFLFAHGRDPQQGWTPLGPVVDVWLKSDERRLWAVLKFDTDERSEMYWKKVQSGSLKGISIRYAVGAWLEIEAGKVARGFSGPASVAIDWEVIEISLEPTPADPNVGGGRSEEFEDFMSEPISENEERNDENMNPNKVQTQTPVVEEQPQVAERTAEPTPAVVPAPQPTAPTSQPVDAEAVRVAAVQLERARITEITNICRKMNIDPKEHIDNGTTVERMKEIAFERWSQEQSPVPNVQMVKDEADKFRAAAIDAMCTRGNIKVEKLADGANDLRGYSLMDMVAECLERTGVKTRGMSKDDMVRSALNGTADFPYIVSNVAHKSMMQGYEMAPTTYQLWTKRGILTDFKPSQRTQLSEAPGLLKVGENGEFEHGKMKDNAEYIKLETFGRLFSLTRQAIVNDDMNAFTEVPMKFGAAARRLVNDTVYVTLVSDTTKLNDGKDLFHADHANLGTAAKISITSLDDGMVAMSTQKNLNGEETLNISPAFLLVPMALKTTAKQIIASTVDPTKQNNVMNPFQDELTVIADANLDKASKKTWYLAAAPGYVNTLEVAFLNGEDRPFMDQQMGFEIDGIVFKVRLDFGVKALDYRGLFKNPGA